LRLLIRIFRVSRLSQGVGPSLILGSGIFSDYGEDLISIEFEGILKMSTAGDVRLL